MTDTPLFRSIALDTVEDPADAGRLDGRLLPYGVPATVTDGKGPAYVETWAPGSLRAAADATIPVFLGHDPVTGERGPLIGRVDDVTDTDDGAHGTIVLADTGTARDARELARTVGAFLSVEVVPGGEEWNDDRTAVLRTGGTLTGLALVLPPARPAHPDAEVLAVRQAPPDPPPIPEEPAMTDTVAPDTVAADTDDDTELIRSAAAAQAVAAYVAAPAHDTASPLAQFRSLAEFADAMYDSPDPLLMRAWVDEITTENPGVIPPSWVSDVKGIVNLGRPTIAAFGQDPAGPSGMEVDFPYFDGDLSALVGVQATEKTAITSVKVSIKKGSAPLVTYAGGSDVSYQLIRRSSPSYRDAYLRIMAAAYAAVTDAAAAADAVAAAGDWVSWDVAAADAGGEKLKTAVFGASVKVEAATGSPASFVLAATDVFTKAGGVLNPAPVVNASGTALARTLAVEVSGLPVIHDANLAAGSALVSNDAAGSWVEDGPFTVTAEDVQKLGQDVAVWGMGAFVPYLPAGIVSLQKTAPAAP